MPKREIKYAKGRPTTVHKETFTDAIKAATTELVVEIANRTTRMAAVMYALDGLANERLLPKFLQGGTPQVDQIADHFRQLRDITLKAEGGEELSFIAKVPPGHTFSELVQPDEALVEAIRGLKDGEVLKVSCSPTQTHDPTLNQTRVTEPQQQMFQSF